MMQIALDRPWLELDLGAPCQVLSWAVNRPGLVTASRILWREVRNADLPPELDVGAWLSDELRQRQATDAVTFLTSRDIRQYTQSIVKIGETEAHAVVTVGFSNAERVAHRVARTREDWGTINVALFLTAELTEAAMLETMSIAVQARTAAVMDVQLDLPTGRATGTGTDCVAIASPPGAARYAGLHTEIGEAAGRAVYTAVQYGAREWMAAYRGTKNATA